MSGALPACASKCSSVALASLKCSLTDYLCQCADLEANRVTYKCLVPVCSKADINSMLEIGNAICAAVGYTYTDEAMAYITSGSTTSQPKPTGTARLTLLPSPSSASGLNLVGESTPNSSNSPNGNSQKSGGLPTAAIVGISIGATLVLVLFAIGIWCCVRRKKKNPPVYNAVQAQPQQQQQLPQNFEHKPPMVMTEPMQPASPVGMVPQKHENFYAPPPPSSPPPPASPPPQTFIQNQYQPQQQQQQQQHQMYHEVPSTAAAPNGFYEMPAR